jgi:hypothetical protein
MTRPLMLGACSPQLAPRQNSDEQCAVNAAAAHVLVIGCAAKKGTGMPRAGLAAKRSNRAAMLGAQSSSFAASVRHRAPRAAT